MTNDASDHGGAAASDGAGDSGGAWQRRLLVVPSWSNHFMSNVVQAETSQGIPRQTFEVSYGQYSEEAGIIAAMLNERVADGHFAMQAAS